MRKPASSGFVRVVRKQGSPSASPRKETMRMVYESPRMYRKAVARPGVSGNGDHENSVCEQTFVSHEALI